MTHPENDLRVPGTALQLSGGAGADESFEFETLHSEQTFAPGFYWTCTEACGDVDLGETLLLLDVNEFEGNPHSVKLRYHPRDGDGVHTIMVDKFMASFVPCQNADEIRQREQQAVMQTVSDLQADLMRTQMDPQLMIAAVREDVERQIRDAERAAETPDARVVEKTVERQRNLAKTHRRAARRSEVAGNPLTTPRAALASDIGDLIGAGINETGLAEMSKLAGRQAIIAGAQAAWLQKKTGAIAATLTKLAPYIAERSAVALARASGAVKMSERIRRGIASLDLYTGKGVDCFDIRTGAAAATSEPLTIIQGKRYAEEEFAAFADVTSDFDFRNKQQFFDAIASNDELMRQVLPTPRCVVSVAMTRNDREYGDALANLLYNIQNALVFLLVRNGDNVHVVYSSSPSHEGAKRLFPTKDELQRPFTGFDGARISIRDTEFGDASKWFDDIALVYRRFLILLCGLDHRLQLFGEFYPPERSMSFMTAEFQETYMRFLADDEGAGWLIGDELPALGAWMAERNKMTQSGSRIFVLGRSAAIEEHAPEIKRRYNLKVVQEQFKAPIVAQREGARFFVSLEASDSGNVQQVKCWLSKEENSAHDSAWWLCVDDVSLEEVRRYRHSRVYRSMGIAYLRLFRRLESYLESELESEHESREYLVKAATEFGGLTPELARLSLDGAIRNYRASRRGAALPGVGETAELNKVLNLMVPEGHISTTVSTMLEAYIETTGATPLLLTRTGKAKLMLYVEASATDKAPYPDVLTWGWVRRITLDIGKTKLKEAGDSLVWLSEVLPASQVELRRWAGLEAWLNTTAEPVSLRVYGSIPALLDAAKEWEPVLRAGPGTGIEPALFARVAAAAKRIHDDGARTTMEYAILGIPVAVYSAGGQVLSMAYMQANCENVLYTYGNPEQRALIQGQFTRIYKNKAYAQSVLDAPLKWALMSTQKSYDTAHDAPAKNFIPGSNSEPKWSKRSIRVNKNDFFFSTDKAAKKRGGPHLRDTSATLSFDRAFDQLTGRAPGGLVAAFRRGKLDRLRSVSRWQFDREAPDGETRSQRTARWNAKYGAIASEPYVHIYKSQLSPLVLKRPDGRTQANALFTQPLLALRKHSPE